MLFAAVGLPDEMVRYQEPGGSVLLAVIQKSWPNALRLMTLCVCTLLAMNCTFLIVRLADHSLPRYRIADHLRTAFADGSATASDYPRTTLAGIDQYTDCVVFELAVVSNEGWFSSALAPRILSPEGVSPGSTVSRVSRCAEIQKFLNGGSREDIAKANYTRFWNGPATLLALALMVMPLDGYRALLLTASLGLIALSAVLTAMRGRAMLFGLSPLLFLSFMFDGQVGFGQLVSHAPSHIASWTIAAGLVATANILSDRRIALLAVGAGSIEAFIDYILSVPLSAGIFVVVAVAVSLSRWQTRSAVGALARAASFAGAWVFGFAGTYLCKIVVTIPVLGWAGVVTPFIDQLRFRMGTVDPERGLFIEGGASMPVAILRNLTQLGENLWRLGYSDERPHLVSAIIVFAGGIGWVLAVWRVLRAPSRDRRRLSFVCGVGYLTASLLMLAWVAALPEHTWRHFWFMVRSAMIWVAAGWGWVLTDFAATSSRSWSTPSRDP